MDEEDQQQQPVTADEQQPPSTEQTEQPPPSEAADAAKPSDSEPPAGADDPADAEEPDAPVNQLEEKLMSNGLTHLQKAMDGQRFAPATLILHGTETTTVDILAQLPYLRSVDLAENQIRDIKGLAQVPALVWLNLSQNFIRKLPADFMNLQYLQHLNLSQNQLSKLQLSNLPSLAYLNVAGNQLQTLTINGLAGLQSLEARQNSIKKVSLDAPNLKFLYLTDNKLKDLKGLDKLPNVERLYLRNNELESVDSLPTTLQNLQHLNLRRNSIATFDSLSKLADLPKLHSLILLENALCELENYRMEILSRVPQVQVIDRVPVTEQERHDAGKMRSQRNRAPRPAAAASDD